MGITEIKAISKSPGQCMGERADKRTDGSLSLDSPLKKHHELDVCLTATPRVVSMPPAKTVAKQGQDESPRYSLNLWVLALVCQVRH